MPAVLANTLLVLLPVALCLAAWRFQVPAERLTRLLPERSVVQTGRYAAFAALAAAPLMLMLLAHGSLGLRIAGSLFSGIAALLGFYLLGGRPALLLAVVLTVLPWLEADPSAATYDLLALACAIAAGLLLSRVLSALSRLLFLGLLALLDVAVVSAHLTSAALFPASFVSAFPPAGRPPLLSGFVCSGYFLGGIDLACAVLVGRSLREQRLPLIPALTVYLLAQTLLAALVGTGALHAFPAALAPAAALLAAVGVSRRRSPS